MKKEFQVTFIRSEFSQYEYILRDQEIRTKIASFILRYISLEGFYKKLLIVEKESNGKKLTDKEKRNLTVTKNEVKKVLLANSIQVDEDLIERVFGSNDSNYMECSLKKLRNRLVHNVNEIEEFPKSTT